MMNRDFTQIDPYLTSVHSVGDRPVGRYDDGCGGAARCRGAPGGSETAREGRSSGALAMLATDKAASLVSAAADC